MPCLGDEEEGRKIKRKKGSWTKRRKRQREWVSSGRYRRRKRAVAR